MGTKVGWGVGVSGARARARRVWVVLGVTLDTLGPRCTVKVPAKFTEIRSSDRYRGISGRVDSLLLVVVAFEIR